MIYEQYIKSEAFRTLMARVSHEMYTAGAYTFFLEAINLRTRVEAAEQRPLEAGAIRDAFRRGYFEALTDIFEFEARFLPTATKPPPANFGASEELFNAGELSTDEYRAVTGREPPTK